MFHTYSLLTEMCATFGRNCPLSCIRSIYKYYYAIVNSQTSDKVKGLPIEVTYLRQVILSQWITFHNVDIDMILTNNNLIEFGETYITKYLLLLPKLGKARYTNTE